MFYKRLIFSLLLLSACGCTVSRSQYLRDRLEDSLAMQKQAGFNAEVLRRMEELENRFEELDPLINREPLEKTMDSIMADIFKRFDERQKKMDERKGSWDCVYSSTSIVCYEKKRPSLKYIPGDIVDPYRPNWPCYRCGEEKPK